MKIALFTDGITPYVIGGMQRHSFYLVKYFALSGIFVDLYHTNQSELEIEKLEIFTEEEKKRIRSFVVPFPSGGKLPGHYIRASYLYAEAIFKVFKESGPVDFIYAQGFTAWKLLEEKHKGYICAPIGVNFHGFEMFQQAPDLKSFLASKFLLRKPVLYNINSADYVFTFGGKIKKIAEDNLYSRDKIIEMVNGIESSWLSESPLEPSKKLKFVFVGRFERRKGIKELTEVLKGIQEKCDIEFHFIGPIPKKQQLKLDNIFYHGLINSTEKMKDLLQKMDVLVCPSHSEGMPYVILEGMASGLAIIATDVGAVSLMVSEKNGRLIPAADKKELEKAILNFCSLSQTVILDLKRKSQQIIKENFLWDRIIEITKSKIEEVSNQIH